MARRVHEIAPIPMVFVSAFEQDVLENDSTLPKPYRYVIKPFTLLALQAAMRELLPEV